MAKNTGPRKNIVSIYLTDEEKAILTKTADNLGLGLVPWLRMLAVTKARKIISKDT